ncbi:hypothetical protein [Vulcanisaeta sp. JCM 16159]|nr:hypothetical protein [Vulcanisaeta sp. JCM 16159]
MSSRFIIEWAPYARDYLAPINCPVPSRLVRRLVVVVRPSYTQHVNYPTP